MKKIILALFVLVALIIAIPFANVSALAFDEATYYLYCKSNFDDSATVIANGGGKIIVCRSINELVRACFKSTSSQGVSFTVSGKLATVEQLLDRMHAQVVFSESFDGLSCVYAYSPDIGYGITVDGRYINLQIAERDGKITVGSPIILGGY